MYAVEHGHVGGLELSRRFYREVVQPLLNRHFGPSTHTAALIGTGSEVLGFDTERSTDHDWGPRLPLFLGPGDIDRYGEAIDTMLAERLPATYDVWRYVLACQWQRVSQEEAFVGRCGEVGDELGSAVTCARLVRDLMRLTLLMARRYPPYGKWLGSAFARLPTWSRTGRAAAA
jgi:hypothetical protein